VPISDQGFSQVYLDENVFLNIHILLIIISLKLIMEGMRNMQFTFLEIDHVQVAAPKGCEEKAREFYGELLGMQEIPKPKNLQKRGGVWFQCGNHQLHIGVQETFQPAVKAHPAFHVKNLAKLREHLMAKGIEIKEEEPLEGADRFYVSDPFGNRLEFLEWF
jgi:catechol 2,3-dioxygenase-like lactoylglutathione lyase family enzyme